ncbi:hypothetical protein C8R43DRAFT_1119688 [Mycena crocata]|nr:hypothetical protein C8R43DRAFT_1119688 [Mycena crocata]
MVLGPNGMGSGKSSIACAICLARHWSPGVPRASTLAADTGSIVIGVVEGAQGAVGDAGAHGVPRYRDRAARAQCIRVGAAPRRVFWYVRSFAPRRRFRPSSFIRSLRVPPASIFSLHLMYAPSSFSRSSRCHVTSPALRAVNGDGGGPPLPPKELTENLSTLSPSPWLAVLHNAGLHPDAAAHVVRVNSIRMHMLFRCVQWQRYGVLLLPGVP